MLYDVGYEEIVWICEQCGTENEQDETTCEGCQETKPPTAAPASAPVKMAAAKQRLLINTLCETCGTHKTEPRKIVFLGRPGAGKSSLINSFAAPLGGEWYGYAPVAPSIKGKPKSIHVRRFPKCCMQLDSEESGENVKMYREEYHKYLLPTLVDVAGLSDEAEGPMKEFLTLLLYGHIPKNAKAISVYEDCQNLSGAQLRAKYKTCYEDMRIDVVVFVASVTDPLPVKLMECVADIAGSSHTGETVRAVPIFGVLTRKDEVEQLGKVKDEAKQLGKVKNQTEHPGKVKVEAEQRDNVNEAEQLGKVKDEAEQLGKVKDEAEQPGKVKDETEQPGKVKVETEQPEKVKVEAEHPGKVQKEEEEQAGGQTVEEILKNFKGMLGLDDDHFLFCSCFCSKLFPKDMPVTRKRIMLEHDIVVPLLEFLTQMCDPRLVVIRPDEALPDREEAEHEPPQGEEQEQLPQEEEQELPQEEEQEWPQEAEQKPPVGTERDNQPEPAVKRSENSAGRAKTSFISILIQALLFSLVFFIANLVYLSRDKTRDRPLLFHVQLESTMVVFGLMVLFLLFRR